MANREKVSRSVFGRPKERGPKFLAVVVLVSPIGVAFGYKVFKRFLSRHRLQRHAFALGNIARGHLIFLSLFFSFGRLRNDL